MTDTKLTELEKLEELILQYKEESDKKRKHVIYINLVEETLQVVKRIVMSFYPLPISVSTFGSFAPFAVLGNLIILPLITVTFLYISVCGVATGIHGMAGIMFRPAKYPIWLLREISTLISKFPGAEIGVTGGFASAFFYVLLMLILNPRMRMNKKVRIVSASICGVVTMFCFGFGI